MANDLTTMLSAFLAQLWAGAVTYPIGGTSVTETSSGVLTQTSNPTSAAAGYRILNGAGPEYGAMLWNTNFFNVGTVINGGTARNTRVISASTSVLLATSSGDSYVFTNAGIIRVAGLVTVGVGTNATVAAGAPVAQTAALPSIATYTVGATDADFEIGMTILVTTATTHTFTAECAYTSTDNTARILTIPFTLLAGTQTTSITNTNGAVPYLGVTTRIRAKSATAITLRTQAAGTYTTVTYNATGIISQLTL